MRSLLTILIILLTQLCLAQSAEKTVITFFDALNDKDVETLSRLTNDDISIQSLTISDEVNLTSETKANFLTSIKNIPRDFKIEEKIFDLRSLSSDDIVQYLMSYKFYVNGKFSHKGHNAITLIKMEGKWVIVSIVDTRDKR